MGQTDVTDEQTGKHYASCQSSRLADAQKHTCALQRKCIRRTNVSVNSRTIIKKPSS